MKKEEKTPIYQLYLELKKKFGAGKVFWPEWCASKKSPRLREAIAMGAILTQRTSWHNAELALKALQKEKLLSLKKIAGLKTLDHLTDLIRPAGFFQTKPKRLWRFCSLVVGQYSSLANFAKIDWRVSREKLLALKGIGPETADTILLYALDKPTFVVDEYTQRWVAKKKLTKNLSYEAFKEFFESQLPKKASVYQEFHVLIIADKKGKTHTTMRRLFSKTSNPII